jgi:hypothetical protein
MSEFKIINFDVTIIVREFYALIMEVFLKIELL